MTPSHGKSTPMNDAKSLRILRTALLVLVIALIAAVVVWIVNGNGGGDGEEAEAPVAPGAARIVSPAELGEAAATSGAAIYWAGERSDAELELSEVGAEAKGGEASRTYVRYLTGGAEAGDPKPAYLTIGTYSEPHAYGELKSSAKSSGAKLRNGPRAASAPGRTRAARPASTSPSRAPSTRWRSTTRARSKPSR